MLKRSLLLQVVFSCFNCLAILLQENFSMFWNEDFFNLIMPSTIFLLFCIRYCEKKTYYVNFLALIFFYGLKEFDCALKSYFEIA